MLNGALRQARRSAASHRIDRTRTTVRPKRLRQALIILAAASAPAPGHCARIRAARGGRHRSPAGTSSSRRLRKCQVPRCAGIRRRQQPLSILRPARAARSVLGTAPMPTSTRSALDSIAIDQADDRPFALSRDTVDCNAAANVDAFERMAFGDDAGNLIRHAALQHALQSFENRHISSERPRRRGKFQADKAAADDHNALAGHHGLAKGNRVRMGAQRTDMRRSPRRSPEKAVRERRSRAGACRAAMVRPSESATDFASGSRP